MFGNDRRRRVQAGEPVGLRNEAVEHGWLQV
jgi:hypothetical protein